MAKIPDGFATGTGPEKEARFVWWRRFGTCSAPRGSSPSRCVIITILCGTFAQIIIAYDYTRMLVLAFPAILLSAEYVREMYPKRFATYSLMLIIFNLIITQYQYNFDGAVKIVMNKSFKAEEEKSAIVLHSSTHARISSKSDSKFSGNRKIFNFYNTTWF